MWAQPPRTVGGCNFEKLHLYVSDTKELHYVAGRDRGWRDLSAVGVERRIQPPVPSLPAMSSCSQQLEMTGVDVSAIYTTGTS